MPTDKAVEMLRAREKVTHTKGDIHEVDTEYLAKCRRTALAAAGLLAGAGSPVWTVQVLSGPLRIFIGKSGIS